jgi:hypothetical protein
MSDARAGRVYEDAVRWHLGNLIEQHERGELDWRGEYAHVVAAYLEAWSAGGVRSPHVAEPLWRYYEWANEPNAATGTDDEPVGWDDERERSR